MCVQTCVCVRDTINYKCLFLVCMKVYIIFYKKKNI